MKILQRRWKRNKASSKYKSVILSQAQEDINKTLDYVKNTLLNPTASKNLLDDIIRAVEDITIFPYSLSTIKNTEYRYKVVNNFLLVYKVLEELKEVRIMAFLYAKSDVLTNLIKRL